MWIDTPELDLLDKVFDSKEIVPKNRKNGLKLRHLSFFMSNMKAITNVCKSLEKIAMGEVLPHQYTEVLRKMGLIDKDENITRYGNGLFKILYYEDNRIIDEINDPSKTTVDALSEDISFKIEFYLYATVSKLLNDKDECSRCNIEYSDLASEAIDNVEYFVNNIIDTLKEPSNKKSDVIDLFAFNNDDFYYTIQGMNFSGYEIKRLLRMNKDDIDATWKAYQQVLGSVKSVSPAGLTPSELKYYEYADYYTKLVQKDVRKRVKHSLFNYILINSIQESRHRIKIIENKDFAKIMSYDFIREKFHDYQLKDIYDLVFFEDDSKYITDIIKPFAVDYSVIKDIDTNNVLCVVEKDLRKKHINRGDKVIFTDDIMSKIYKMYVYGIQTMTKKATNVEVEVERLNEINRSKEKDILDEFKR
jgi:hypothetical protein